MTVRELLQSSGLTRMDAEVILSFVLGKPRTWLTAHDEYTLTAEERATCEACVERRMRGEPVSTITGEKEFYGRMFTVTRDVLTPRPSTEQLTECTLDFLARPRLIEREVDTDISVLCVPLSSGAPEVIMDVGTGCGCIAATLVLEGRRETMLAVDTSEEALAVARRNCERLGAVVTMAKGDGPGFVRAMHQPFFIVSNPPYIPEGTELARDVLDFEPHDALFAGPDGTAVLRSLAESAAGNPQCLGIALELMSSQVIVVKKLLGVM